jgi:ABC-2 type transport system ATP-binding protein
MSLPLAIQTRNLTKEYGGRAVVDGVKLTVPEGTIFGFLGPNGAGKSTTVRMLAGRLRPSAGTAVVAGVDPVREPARLKSLVGYMPQQFGLYNYLTAAENLDFYANLYLSSRREARDRTRELILATELGPHAGKPASALSGGWRQRLALACAIVHRPRLLFLDEPTVGVDPVARRLFWDLVHRLNDGGVTIFVTTHYMEEVERCHLVGLIAEGRLRTCGAPAVLRSLITRARELIAVLADDPRRAYAVLAGLDGLVDIYFYGQEVHLSFVPGRDGLAAAREATERAGLRAALEVRASSMEDVFVHAVAQGDSS